MHELPLLHRNNGYLARQEIEKIRADYAEYPLRLENFGYKVYSQSDEDGIIEEIFNRFKIEKGTFFEIGVESGFECNTHYLLHKGWTGTWVDVKPISGKFNPILGKQLNYIQKRVTPDNINDLVKEDVEFLSIDIDGMDIFLLEALKARPKVICIEYNSKWPAHIYKKPVYSQLYSWQFTDYMGASLKALTETANEKGYTLVGTNLTGTNAFYVRNDYVGDYFYKTNDVAKLYNPPRYWLIFDHYNNIGHPADFGAYTDFQS